MKNVCIAFSVLALLAVMIACSGSSAGGGSGGDSIGTGTNPPVAAFNFTGNWELTATSTAINGRTMTIVGYLNHSENTITGTVHVVANNSCFPGDYVGGVQDVTVTGTVNNNNVNLTFSDLNGQVVSISATAQSESALSGTYGINGGCAGGDKGSLSGFKIPPLTGKWSGTFKINSDTANVSADLVQGPPLHGLATISGSVTFTGSSCFSGTGVIRGDTGDVIGGTHLFIRVNIPSDNPTQQVQLIGTTTPTGNSITGDLDVNFGTCNTQSGTASLQKQ